MTKSSLIKMGSETAEISIIITHIRHLSNGFTKSYYTSCNLKELISKYEAILPYHEKAYGLNMLKKQKIKSHIHCAVFCYFHCASIMRTRTCAIFCDVISHQKHCLQCIENFVKHWMHSTVLV